MEVMMKIDKVKQAEFEAKRFLNKLHDYMALCEEEKKLGYIQDRSKEASALKRSSLDLSRALADMRRS